MTYQRSIKYKKGSFYAAKMALLSKWELAVINDALKRHEYNIRKAAKALSMSYGSFYLLVRKHGMKTEMGKVSK